jgi:pyruvate kinase
MLRRTKIVSTLGPATDEPGVLEKLILAGVNVVRLNFSHGSPEEHKRRCDMTRELAAKHGRYVAVLGDLQGPKIRVARFAQGPIKLNVGDKFVLDADLGRDEGNQHQVGIDYKELPRDVAPGDLLLLDDGRVVLKVDAVEGNKVFCTTTVAGKLSNNKGINRQGGGLTAPALTDKDMADIKTAVAIDVDYLAVSFPRSADDMHLTRQLVREAGGEIALVAKIERAEAVNDTKVLDDLIRASDAVMVARGDLGVEIGDAALIGVQKHIIARARSLNRAVITATQMMESMITSSLPTRAEVFDVANAVLDGTDAVMLSAETAAGQFPVETVEAMVRVILGAEGHPLATQDAPRELPETMAIDQAIAQAAMFTAKYMPGVAALISLTESGSTPFLMSRFGASLPIFALSPNTKSLQRCALYRGVYPVAFPLHEIPFGEVNQRAVSALMQKGVVQHNDLVIISQGDTAKNAGGTNAMKIVQIGKPIY